MSRMGAGASRPRTQRRRGGKRREAEGFSFSGVLSRKVRGLLVSSSLFFFFFGPEGRRRTTQKFGQPRGFLFVRTVTLQHKERGVERFRCRA